MQGSGTGQPCFVSFGSHDTTNNCFLCVQALAKYAFGMGTLQMVFCTGAFCLAGLPVGQGLVTQFLEDFGHASHNLVSIRTVDEVRRVAGIGTKGPGGRTAKGRG